MKAHDSNNQSKFENHSNRRDFIKKASVGGLGAGLLGANIESSEESEVQSKPAQKAVSKSLT